MKSFTKASVGLCCTPMATKKKAKKAPAKKQAKRATVAAKKRPPAKKTAKRAAPKRAAKKQASAKKTTKRAAPKRTAKKQAPAKKRAAAKKRAPTKKATAGKASSVQRRDRPGHIDPQYAAELRARAGHEDDVVGFVARPRSHDDLVEELGEEFVESATSAEPVAEDVANQDVPEEVGGPFVETTARQELADDTDESNPEDATREPFPTT